MEGRDEKGRFTEKNLWAYVKKNVGRTRLYNTPEELLEKGLEFYDWCDETRKGKYTEAGLRLWLGMSKKNWSDYKKDPNFVTSINILEDLFEDDLEQKLMWAGSTQGAIFKLKNKHGWKDETHNEVNQTNRNITVSFGSNSIQPSRESNKDS